MGSNYNDYIGCYDKICRQSHYIEVKPGASFIEQKYATFESVSLCFQWQKSVFFFNGLNFQMSLYEPNSKIIDDDIIIQVGIV